ncbi:hypothetical protein [Actinomadura sp. NEAU-AAG7]|uniref:hypothetical protein n=1 Tax=Actinomadura sp. NEAU-AAG7 TaxID=2839640 RepID=UPI001BE49F1F|nr:hypothetical protein [Actinomadura sp. NEAU-AAG7]MBT2213468.1 hypothetical protein [Actinomadura sp. NEAU-AAG7]
MPTPPKWNPARGKTQGRGPVTLPAEGRVGDPPPWPLDGKPTRREAAAWRALWALPQAVAWERFGWTRGIARYCRHMVRAEASDASPALLAQTLAMEDRLGLTPKGMRLLLWEVALPADDAAPAESVSDIRKRIKAV